LLLNIFFFFFVDHGTTNNGNNSWTFLRCIVEKLSIITEVNINLIELFKKIFWWLWQVHPHDMLKYWHIYTVFTIESKTFNTYLFVPLVVYDCNDVCFCTGQQCILQQVFVVGNYIVTSNNIYYNIEKIEIGKYLLLFNSIVL